MHPIIEGNRPAIAGLCRRYGVRRLDLFGSILRPDFDVARSDVDVLVEFGGSAEADSFERYLALQQELEQLFGRPVDLVEAKAIRNRRLRYYIEQDKQPVYAEA